MGLPEEEISTARPPLPPTTAEPAGPVIVEPMDIEDTRPTRTKVRMSAILLGLYLCIFIAALDQTILATSIPTIAAQLHSASGYAWIASAYFLANAASSPVWAKFSDIWGRKLALLASVVLFAASSIMAALSRTSHVLIAARALQGIGAGGLNQLALITISDLFSMRQRTVFLGLVNVCWGLAGGVGPLIGGALTEYASWRWCFWVNLPVCAISLVLLFFFLDVHNPRTGLRDGVTAFDWLGTVSIVGVTLMLLMGLDFGGVIFPWSSPTVICLIIFGFLLIGFFVFTEKRLAKFPLMPMQIFTTLSTNASFLVCFMHGMSFIGLDFYTPLYTQSVKGRTPLQSGLLMLPNVVFAAATGISAGFYMLRTGRYREIISLGLFFLTLGTGLYIMLNVDSGLGLLVGCEILTGFGSGFVFEPPMVALQAVTAQDETAAATAAFGFTRNMATTVSIVLGAVVFQNGMAQRQSSLRAAGLNSTLIEAFSGANAQANVGLIKTIQDTGQKKAVESAFAYGLRNVWIMYTCVVAVGLVASLFIKHVDLKTEHTETRTGIKKQTEGNATTGS